MPYGGKEAGGTAAVRVFVLDDHAVVRAGLRAVLSPDSGCAVVGDAATLGGALRGIAVTRPHVAVVDLRLSRGDGVGAVREIRSRYPRVRCLVFTSFPDEVAFAQSRLAGASGYLLKDTSSAELVRAIRGVAAGETVFDADRLVDTGVGSRPDQQLLRDLTVQERRILDLVAEGRTNRDIANSLFLAEKTVRNYVSSILAKLGMQNRTQVASYIARLDTRLTRRAG